MFWLQTIFSAFWATSAMTVFSYALSWLMNSNFKEPKNLAILLRNLFPHFNFRYFVPIGWLLHYMVGFVFAAPYCLLWRYDVVRPTILSGSLLGFISGFAGIGIWHFTLSIHPRPHKINLKEYYPQLVVAHIVFGVMAAWVYKMQMVN
jgi:hypothetical protein